ncbi:hypothetical protein U1708_12615 [Sphingomonas sp. ZB1N12]|uniref:hypothetical protein n=1 Tax=Sphingomonas arabinosi TaxID=3096160 RepID=UPI002FC885B6
MAPRISKGRIVAGAKAATARAGKRANVRTRVRFNFVEAQRQILDKSRQIKAARGVLIALLMSILVWAIVAKLVF